MNELMKNFIEDSLGGFVIALIGFLVLEFFIIFVGSEDIRGFATLLILLGCVYYGYQKDKAREENKKNSK